MKYLIAITLIVVSLVALNPADYWPAEIGNSWVEIDSSEDGIDTTTSEIVDTTTIMGYLTYLHCTSDYEDTSYFQFRTDGFYNLAPLDEGATSYLELHVIPNPFAAGNEWTILDMDTSWVETPYTYYVTQTYSGSVPMLEDVVVPAGSFFNCVKLNMYLEQELFVTMGADTIYSSVGPVFDNTMWLAEGIGPVMTYEFDYEDSMEYISKLLSYDLTSIDEKTFTPNNIALKAYPNPFNSAVRIENPGNSPVEIYDLKGQLVEKLDYQDGVWVPSRELNSGVFLIKTDYQGKSLTNRLLYLK